MKKNFKGKELKTLHIGLQLMKGKRLPVQLLRAINLNKKRILEEIEVTESSRKEIAESYCLKDNNGSPVIKDEHYTFSDSETEKKCIEAVEELFDTEIEIDICTVPFQMLIDCDNDKYDSITGEEYDNIEFMIEDKYD